MTAPDPTQRPATTLGDVVYAACRECQHEGPLTIVDKWDHCEDGVGGMVLRVLDEQGQTHLVFGHDVATTPYTAVGGVR
jgi:hypothetical protein